MIPALTLTNIVFTYPGTSEPLLDGIDVTFARGWTAVLGDNGIGKTTLAKLAIGRLSPDAGRIRVAEQWAQRLGGGPLAFVHKTRDITRPNQAKANRVVGDVKGKDCVLVDDLIDTAGTIAGACQVLREAGARSVTVVATHGVLSGPAVDRLKSCGAREVVLTDTVPIPEEKRWDGLTVLSIAPLLSSAIKAVFEDGSVAELFDTYPEHHGQGFLFA